MKLVRSLADVSDDAGECGGKALGLGALVRAGFVVPPGFVVVASAYRAFVAERGIGARIQALAASARPEDPSSLEAASRTIRALFHEGELPSELCGEVARGCAELGPGPLAVRSSGTAEDLPEASFAGQHESFLGVEGRDALLDALRRCWASLWTPRAIAYRARRAVPHAGLALAVVIQRLVDAEAAGVLFSADPVSGRRDRLAIDAAWGLGEALVAGRVSPDHWLVDARSGAVLEARVANKEVMAVRRAGGTALAPVPAERRAVASLRPAELGALVGLGQRIATRFSIPQDVEWALAGGRVFVLQTRPITSLFPLPEPAPPSEGGPRVHVCLNFLQGLVEPLTPAGIDLLGHLARGPAWLFGVKLPPDAAPPPFRAAAGRVYLDVTEALRHRHLRRALLGVASLLDQPTAQILEELCAREPSLAPRAGRPPVRPRARVVLRVLARVLAVLAAPERGRRRALARMERVIGDLEREADSLTGSEARARWLAEAPPRLFPALAPNVGPAVGPGIAARLIAERLLERWLRDASRLEPVLRALPHNPTTRMDLDLWRLSRRLAAEGAAPAPDHPGVREFLSRYGHRAVREIDAGMPRWSEDPGYVLGLLDAYLRAPADHDPEQRFRLAAEEAERAASALVAEVRRRRGPVRALALRLVLARLRALAGLREYPKFFGVRFIAAARRVLEAEGAELAAAGRLERADDVFFLRFPERNGNLRALAAARRAEYARELLRRAVPRVIAGEGESFFAPAAPPDGALVGTPASAGVHEGRVRVVHDPRTAALEPGEVLVALGTDPAWTPLFLVAGALVMEIGGAMSHGSIVARECGIPAVVGVPGATLRLRTGQRVRVDGQSGVVQPLD